MAVVVLNSTATLFAAIGETSYSAAREKTGVNLYAAEFGWIGQYLDGGTYEVDQVFARFDLSSLPAGAVISAARLILTVAESYGTHTIEARASTFTAGNAASFIAGSGLAAKTLLGSASMVDGFNVDRPITLTDLTPANLASVVLFGQGQRTGTAPTGGTATRVTAVKLEVTYSILITTTGTGSWTVPAGVTSITVETWSGGQGGSADRGGRGGNFAQSTITVTPGASISYSIGAGGNGVQYASNVNGGDTWFSSASTYLAKGGGATTGNIANGVSYYGGSGGGAMSNVAGGGGGSARANGAGGNASNFDGAQASLTGGSSGSTTGGVYGGTTAGGSNIEGGAGGAGLSGGAGGAPGGGGGGGGPSSPGGAGGRGQLRITWSAAGGDPTPITRLHRAFFWL